MLLDGSGRRGQKWVFGPRPDAFLLGQCFYASELGVGHHVGGGTQFFALGWNGLSLTRSLHIRLIYLKGGTLGIRREEKTQSGQTASEKGGRSEKTKLFVFGTPRLA